MPGLDGTGPAGMGPMTGGRRGLCTGYGGAYQMWGPRRFFGRGGGRGRGWRNQYWATGMPGWSRWGWSAAPPPTPYGYGYDMTREEELSMLKAQNRDLTEELDRLNDRIKELEKS